MIISPSTLDAAFINFDTRFQQVFKETPTYWAEMASLMPSSTSEERHAWLKSFGDLVEWVGARQIDNISTNLQSLINKKYQKAFSVPREKIEDDQLGVYGPAVDQLARAAAQWPDAIVTTALQAGTGAACHDGQNFFATAHPVNPDDAALSTQSNNHTGKALTPTNFDYVRTKMRNLKGENGISLGINPTHLIVPPDLESVAKQILEAEYLVNAFGANAATGSQSNILKGTAKVLVVPRLANEATTWYLADMSRAVKPLLFQQRFAPEFTWMNKTDDANVFLQDEFMYGVRARGVAGYGPYYLISRAIA